MFELHQLGHGLALLLAGTRQSFLDPSWSDRAGTHIGRTTAVAQAESLRTGARCRIAFRDVTASGASRPLNRGRDIADREAELETLDRLLSDVRAGESRALIVHGDPGVGKTALLDYLAQQPSDCRVLRAVAIESEMELAFAGLHQMCGPIMEHSELLPGPQRDALRITFGISEGPAPDRFLLGLAVLSLLSEVAEKRPLICLVDDHQWLDRASAQVLAFVARRLGTESIGLVFATRVRSPELAGLQHLLIAGLPDRDARALLDSVLPGPVDSRVRDRIVAETRGNPLALLELTRGMTGEELAGGFGLPPTSPLTGTIEDSFRRRIEAMPEDTRRLLVLAAADPVGDPVLLWQAAKLLGLDPGAAGPTTGADLIDFGARVSFRHPLVRSAVYWSASAPERQQSHRAIAEVTDKQLDPDRRAWHQSQAARGLDEGIASDLEVSASRAQARGGLAAAAAFLERSAMLTPDPGRRAGRALGAAQAKVQAGSFAAALGLLAMAEAGPLDELQHARLDLSRAQLAFATNRGSDAPSLLLKAAKRLEPVDAGLARATYRDAFVAALFAGRSASNDADLSAVARAAGTAPPPVQPPGTADLVLDGMAATVNQGFAAGAPLILEALPSFGEDLPGDQQMRWSALAYMAAMHVRDYESGVRISDRYVKLARDMGALSELPLALSARAFLMLFAGELASATTLVEEIQAAVDATRSNLAPYSAIAVAAWRGMDANADSLIAVTVRDTSFRGEGLAVAAADWAKAVLSNAIGHYSQGFTAARRATESGELAFSNWALVELIEAAARSGMSEAGVEAHRRLAEVTRPSGTDWALGVEARSHALVSHDASADELYRESIERLDRAGVHAELARAHLLYGEWLRRERRQADAKEQLRMALDRLEAMGMEGFAQRARRELRATGETARKRRVETRGQLTAQEAQVARLACEGLSNPEIGTRLFISSRTVQYHLSKVFTKLDVTSRSQLARVLG